MRAKIAVVTRAPVSLHAGQTYQDPANRKHLIYRNNSLEKPLRFLIALKIKKGVPFKIDL
jgi:hypothetical protein